VERGSSAVTPVKDVAAEEAEASMGALSLGKAPAAAAEAPIPALTFDDDDDF